jgi:plastocyanin
MVGVGEPPDQVGDGSGGGGGGTGGGGGGGGEEGVTPTVSMSVDASTFDLSLGTSGTAEVTLTSVDGYVGDVGVDVTGAMASWNVTVDPATVTLTAGGTATATVTVAIPTDAVAAPDGQDLEIVATPLEDARDLTLISDATATVANVYHAVIQSGTADGAHSFPTVTLRLGAIIDFDNADSVNHRIHSNHDDVGFPHEPAGGGDPGGTYEVTINATGTFNEFYCHDHGAGAGNGVITIVAAE